jgi:uncharacterized protein YecE (DUF72 family)
MTEARIHIGAQSFVPKDWVGSFYPPSLSPRDFLTFYAQIFDTIELNTTFYAIPTPDRVKDWASRTPASFCFTAKLPRLITHRRRLVEPEPELSRFVAVMRRFGPKLGPLLIQLPPSFTRDAEGDLRDFVAGLPSGARYVVEFRHPSWQHPEVADLLGRHDVGWCMNDWQDLEGLRVATTDIAYLRLNGYHDQFEHVDRVQRDRTVELASWAETIDELCPRLAHIYVSINNHYAGHAPATINQLKAMLGLPTVSPRQRWPDADRATQGSLFDR